jgi:hypothetical protein
LTDARGQEVLAEIKGMSGGPVISVDRESGGIRYRLVGLQSEWLPSSKIIRVEKIESVVAFIEVWFRPALAAGHDQQG